MPHRHHASSRRRVRPCPDCDGFTRAVVRTRHGLGHVHCPACLGRGEVIA